MMRYYAVIEPMCLLLIVLVLFKTATGCIANIPGDFEEVEPLTTTSVMVSVTTTATITQTAQTTTTSAGRFISQNKDVSHENMRGSTT